MNRIWFAAKRYGYGWYPATWEGLLVVFVYLVLVFIPLTIFAALGTERIADTTFVMFFLPYMTVLTGALLWICVRKGEPARWRWGK